MGRVLPWLLLIAVAGFALCYQLTRPDAGAAPAPEPSAGAPTLGGLPRSQFFIEHDRFLAATDPQTVTASEATWLRGDDEVFGLVIGGQARAYPIPMISYHHVINDVIRGIPVAVTY